MSVATVFLALVLMQQQPPPRDPRMTAAADRGADHRRRDDR